MRLDIVTNDAGELVRREHARELGAGVVISIYRLVKLAQMHDLANQAFTRQLEQTHQIIGDYCLRSGSNANILFAYRTVFIAGQLLKGSRSTYDAATELGDIFEHLGGFSEIHIQRDLTREELLSFAEQISIAHRSGAQSFRSPTPKIRLRQVADAARLRGIELEDLSPDQRIMRMYASAVVIMRRFYEDLQASRYILPRRIKRIAQSLVDLSEGSTVSFLGVTEVRNANFDEAGRAVNTAILAVSMAREVTIDRVVLSQIAMAAMMHDVARPRAMALMAAAGPAMPGMQGPTTLSEDQEDRLAAGAAAVLTALGRVNEPSITRTVLAFEALWLRRQQWLGPVYWGARAPTLHSKVIAIARRYNDLLTPEPGLPPPTPDYAVAVLAEELRDPQDRTVLRMLVSSLGLLPMGTVVQLATGEVAEVIRGPKGPGEKPRVRLVMDQSGRQIEPAEIELSQDPHRHVVRIMGVDGWRKGLELRPGSDLDGGPPDSDPPQQQMPAPAPAPAPAAFKPPPAPTPAPPPVAAHAMPPPNLPPISPLSPIATAAAPLQQQQAAAAQSQGPISVQPIAATSQRSRAEQYAEQYAAWGEPEPAEDRRSSSSSIQSGEHNSSASLPSMGSSPSAVAEAMGRMINDSLRPPAASPRDAERTVFTPSSEEMADRVTARPMQGRAQREPTARGNLAATPLPHVLVYMLDHALTGSVVFEGGAGDDLVYFVSGVPTKIKLHDPVALLGEILVHGGAIEAKNVDHAVEGARRLGILLGEYLVGHDLVTREALSWALEAQLLNKIAYLANLAPEITYSYYRDSDLLEGWGGGDVPVGCALNPILASVRNWMDRARVRATLNRIGKHALVIHPDANLANLALIPEEQETLEVIRNEAIPLQQLFKRNVADEEVVSSLVYSLAVTRQFAFKGQKKGPMAQANGGGTWKVAPPSASGSIPAGSSSSAAPIPAASGAVASGHPSSSSSRPNVANPVSVSKMAAGAAVDVVPHAGSAPPVSVRKPNEPRPQAQAAPVPAPAAPPQVAPPPGPAAPQPRAMTPAARPPGSVGSLPRANAPQIRPITAKKATIVGIQPAATATTRGAPPSGGMPAGTPGAPKVGPASVPNVPASVPSAPASIPPDPKTIAMAAPTFKAPPKVAAKTPGAGVAAAPPGAARPITGQQPAMPRPSPGLPSKTGSAAARPVAPPQSARAVPAAPPVQPKAAPPKVAAPPAAKAPARPAPADEIPVDLRPTEVGSPPNDDIEIDLDDGGAGGSGAGRGNAIDLSDEMADAEAALEAMQSFRLAEAALQRNDIAGAEKLARKAVEGDPTQADYLSLLAWIRALGNAPAAIEEAIDTMSQVIADDPSNERALFYRAKLFARTNRIQEALADFDELLGANPHHREAAAEMRQLKQRA
ncbi:MAG: hypothetical protein JST00_17565 [Deltaproteobacteria bacterium]|nr:hypothetical protein [Deltaproteobacteria bacterium]